MNEQIQRALTNTWNSIVEYYEKKIRIECPEVIFKCDKRETFFKSFELEYNNILSEYMKENVSSLDRHKQAAIIIKIIAEEHLFSAPNKNGKIFIGCEKIALVVGLSYMLKELNATLKQKGIDREIEKYIFPEAMACETKYIDILTRDLYFQNRNSGSVYTLLVAHILFLLEYWTLKENGINPSVLKE